MISLTWLDKLENPDIDTVIENCWQGIENPYYRDLPGYYKDEYGNGINRGSAIIKSEEGCCAYMHAYGKCHLHKLRHALGEKFPYGLLKDDIEIYDWGCGQGLGTIAVLDELRRRNRFERVKSIHLVDPSSVSTAVAEKLINTLFPGHGFSLEILNRYLPKRRRDFLHIDPSAWTTLHIFSNVLDIEDIHPEEMACTVSDRGNDCIVLVVGPYRQASRVERFIEHIKGRCVKNFQLHENINDLAFGAFNNGHSYSCLIKTFSYTLGPDFVPF